MSDTTVTVFAGPFYLVAPGGEHCYPIDKSVAGRVVIPDGARMVEGKRSASYNPPDAHWLVAPGPVAAVELSTPERRTLDGYDIVADDAVSDRFPASLTEDEFGERFADEDDRYMAERLYRKRYTTTPGEVTTHPTIGLAPMPGGVDGRPDLSWTADQPFSLVYSSNYHHLFPGAAGGYRDRLKAALVAEFGASRFGEPGVYDWEGRHEGQQIVVTLFLDYDTPQWTQAATVSRGRRKPPTSRVQVRKKVEVQVPVRPGTVVRGATKAEAAATLDRLVSEWVEYVKAHRMTVCSHCNGEGSIVARPQAVGS